MLNITVKMVMWGHCLHFMGFLPKIMRSWHPEIALNITPNSTKKTYEPPRGKTNNLHTVAKTKAQISFAVTAKLISAFVFATQIVQFLYFLHPKFPASTLSHLLCLYRAVCVGPVWKPNCWFSHDAPHMCKDGLT